MSVVRLSNITKKYEDILALEDVSFSLEKGECLAVIGPSGAGKSTLLRIIAGLEEADEGKIYFDEVEGDLLPTSKRNVGMMFQTPLLFPEIKVKDNITYGLKHLGYSKEEIENRLSEVSEQLQIIDLLERTTKNLSGGEKQRVELARALVRDVKLLLLDEPFASLDLRLKEELQKEIKQIQQSQNLSMIIVSHDQEEAVFFGDEIAILHEGKLLAKDEPKNLFENPQNVFTASFLGKPKMNFVDGEVCIVKGKMNLDLFGQYKPLEVGCPLQEVLVGIRPTDIKFHPVGEFTGVIEEVDKLSHGYAYKIRMDHELITVESEAKKNIGEIVSFDIELEDLFFFDETGNRIEIH